MGDEGAGEGGAGEGGGAGMAKLARSTRAGRSALVLASGGANGAYEVGVVRALFEGASPGTGRLPLAPRIFTGTSVGAYNAAFLAQHAAAGAASGGWLEEIWRRRIASTVASCGNGVYRLRGDPLRWIDPGCLARPVANLVTTAADAAFWAGYGLVRGLNFLTSDEPLRARTAELFDFGAFFSEAPLAALIEDTIDPARLAASPAALPVTATDWRAAKTPRLSQAAVAAAAGRHAL